MVPATRKIIHRTDLTFVMMSCRKEIRGSNSILVVQLIWEMSPILTFRRVRMKNHGNNSNWIKGRQVTQLLASLMGNIDCSERNWPPMETQTMNNNQTNCLNMEVFFYPLSVQNRYYDPEMKHSLWIGLIWYAFSSPQICHVCLEMQKWPRNLPWQSLPPWMA